MQGAKPRGKAASPQGDERRGGDDAHGHQDPGGRRAHQTDDQADANERQQDRPEEQGHEEKPGRKVIARGHGPRRRHANNSGGRHRGHGK